MSQHERTVRLQGKSYHHTHGPRARPIPTTRTTALRRLPASAHMIAVVPTTVVAHTRLTPVPPATPAAVVAEGVTDGSYQRTP